MPRPVHLTRACDWPLYWFAVLEKAVSGGDHQAAADAQRQLARLGVRVAYGRPPASVPEDAPGCAGGD